MIRHSLLRNCLLSLNFRLTTSELGRHHHPPAPTSHQPRCRNRRTCTSRIDTDKDNVAIRRGRMKITIAKPLTSCAALRRSSATRLMCSPARVRRRLCSPFVSHVPSEAPGAAVRPMAPTRRTRIDARAPIQRRGRGFAPPRGRAARHVQSLPALDLHRVEQRALSAAAEMCRVSSGGPVVSGFPWESLHHPPQAC